MLQGGIYPEGVASNSPGSRKRTLGFADMSGFTPKGLHRQYARSRWNPFGVPRPSIYLPRVRCATLGYWCNPFGVNTCRCFIRAVALNVNPPLFFVALQNRVAEHDRMMPVRERRVGRRGRKVAGVDVLV